MCITLRNYDKTKQHLPKSQDEGWDPQLIDLNLPVLQDSC